MELNNIQEWEKIKQDLFNKKEIIILKYSPTCPISKKAEMNFDNWAINLDEKKIQIIKVNVIYSRTLSLFLADEFSIKHESPQVIWLTKELKVKWNDSHFAIKDSNLNNQI